MKNSKVEIKNIGPIKNVKLSINKINIFMGEQSSGKSTIAKVICFCSWVEKDVAFHQSFDNYNNDKNYFIDKFQAFHKMKGYFNENSEIIYESNTLKFHYQWNNFTIEWNNRFDYKRSKISYIPSERNMVVLPEMEKVLLPNNYLRSFLFDWLDARKAYPKDKAIKLLDLGHEYYFSSDTSESHIQSKDSSYDILLSNASSGLQSITPLVVMVDYLTNIIYEMEQNTSFEMNETKEKVTSMLLSELLMKPMYKEDYKLPRLLSEFQEDLNKRIIKGNQQIIAQVNKYNIVSANLFQTHSTKLIIEEPEQNLFPATQKALIYYLLNSMNGEREHHLTLTTHSPYVLYAINNCIMASLVSDKLTESEKSKLECLKSKINPETISIYQIKEGTIDSIQEKDGLISSNFFDSQMKELMDEFYIMLNHYS